MVRSAMGSPEDPVGGTAPVPPPPHPSAWPEQQQGYGQQPGYGQPPGYGPPGYNAQWQQPPGYPGYAAQQTNGLAIASLVLGILWLYWIGSILALVFGYVAKRQIDDSGGRQGGRGLAVAGIVLGWIGVGMIVLFFVFIAPFAFAPMG